MNDMRLTDASVDMNQSKISAKGVQVYYGDNHAIKDVSVEILDKAVTAVILARRAAGNPPSCAR